MKKVTVTITAAIVGSLFATSFASADFIGISCEEIESGFGVGTTYRVYVDLEQPSCCELSHFLSG